MELQDIIKKRRSARRFKQDKLSRQTLLAVSEAGCFAHTLCNRQVLRFVIIENEQALNNLYKHCSLGLASAGEKGLTPQEYAPPAYIVICSDNKSPENYADAGAAFQNMALSGMEEKLALFWIHAFSEKALRRDLNISQEILAVIAIGYPTETPSAQHIALDEAQNHLNLDGSLKKVTKFKPSSLITWL